MPHTEDGQCEPKALWASDGAALGAPPLAFVTESVDLKLSELHPVNGANTPGLVRLMGLTTHSCHEVDRSLCLRDVVFDTVRRQFRKDPASLTPYRAVDPNCIKTLSKEEPLDDCDRYRN